ncbi:putative hotdog family 3-hydroxylacyl-ACP dehydratase [Oceanisphaera litoralis]|uniref:ApeP family dehydratase n=1 Tax=Oceanisphaera litoralis TaxID=225144 RepID=UPI00195A4208|nr:hypothetical protein [Oceanisphaera litoralis]MBM7456145.1 putative hotdog family 3-hydroxylacyl-ACP dehydratase [Oceanisphaera litoralis]
MKPEFHVDELVPHSGQMSLLSEITGFGEGWLSAAVNITPSSMFADENGVPSWVGLEYMAQAIGAYAGLQERKKGLEPKLGFLLGTRKYSVPVEYFSPGERVHVRVTKNMQAENGLFAFDCELRGHGYEVTASLNIYQPEDADMFLRDTK